VGRVGSLPKDNAPIIDGVGPLLSEQDEAVGRVGSLPKDLFT